MKALRALRTLVATVSPNPQSTHLSSLLLNRFLSAQPQQTSEEDEQSDSLSTFDSSHYELPDPVPAPLDQQQPTWDQKYRAKVNKAVFGEETRIPGVDEVKRSRVLAREEDRRRRAALLAKEMLEAALDRPDGEEDGEEVGEVKEEDQMSLSVGIVGAPNAGKSALTNYMLLDREKYQVGTKVAAVSRKTNTTTDEVLGVMTKGRTQICFFDTPGLLLKGSATPYNDMKVRFQSAWSSIDLYDVLIVIFDVHRHLNRFGILCLI
ncbi:hypothetical protein RJ639_035938 [Escallonia herrerae]|uniref:G domain-containing protein n=1 Tax=Escallonia herrerae TaxID=1293975 RepID=A0AA89B9M9_9ASTE|nr:hypothetical protein RJ639_035938 [Escallonia herrerae]